MVDAMIRTWVWSALCMQMQKPVFSRAMLRSSSGIEVVLVIKHAETGLQSDRVLLYRRSRTLTKVVPSTKRTIICLLGLTAIDRVVAVIPRDTFGGEVRNQRQLNARGYHADHRHGDRCQRSSLAVGGRWIAVTSLRACVRLLTTMIGSMRSRGQLNVSFKAYSSIVVIWYDIPTSAERSYRLIASGRDAHGQCSASIYLGISASRRFQRRWWIGGLGLAVSNGIIDTTPAMTAGEQRTRCRETAWQRQRWRPRTSPRLTTTASRLDALVYLTGSYTRPLSMRPGRETVGTTATFDPRRILSRGRFRRDPIDGKCMHRQQHLLLYDDDMIHNGGKPYLLLWSALRSPLGAGQVLMLSYEGVSFTRRWLAGHRNRTVTSSVRLVICLCIYLSVWCGVNATIILSNYTYNGSQGELRIAHVARLTYRQINTIEFEGDTSSYLQIILTAEIAPYMTCCCAISDDNIDRSPSVRRPPRGKFSPYNLYTHIKLDVHVISWSYNFDNFLYEVINCP